jgi:hypothetical protein
MSSQRTTEETQRCSTAATDRDPQPAPAQQPPVIIQQPPHRDPTSANHCYPTGRRFRRVRAARPSVNMDSTIQTAIDKRLTDDPAFSSLGITASVVNGKVMLIGTVKTEAVKADVERMVKQVKGVKKSTIRSL